MSAEIDQSTLSPEDRAAIARAVGLASSLLLVPKLAKPRLLGVAEIGQDIIDLLAPLVPDLQVPTNEGGCDES